MMKCPKCDGYGKVDGWDGWSEYTCEVCDGKGYLNEQEYTQNCNTEQLAEVLLEWWIDGADTYTQFGLFQHEIDEAKEKIVEWLKQPHTESVTNCNE